MIAPRAYNSIRMDEREKELTKRWIETWRVAGPLLEKIRDEEVARMTDEEGLRIAEMVLSMFDREVAQQLRTSSGLIGQQELFQRSSRR